MIWCLKLGVGDLHISDQIFCAIHCRANAAQFIGIIPTYLHPHFNNYDLRSEFHKVKQKQRTRVSFVEQNELDVS